MQKIRVILFGTGALSKFLTEHLREQAEIVAYLVTGTNEYINGKPTISLEKIHEMEYDYIVVAFGNTIKGIEILERAEVPKEKIVGYAYTGLSYEENLIQKECDRTMREKLRSEKIPEIFDIPSKEYFLCGMNVQENRDIIQRDFVREQTLAFLAEEINRRNIKGNVAEIGVSSGEFAQKINQLFPDRKLYLFDTFEGLHAKDKDKALEMGWGERQYALAEKGTPIEEVLQNMPYREKCIVKKGYFPESFDLEDEFAFVSLDIDFYGSTRSGLEVIYPRLNKGGYLMVHDFHNLSYTETRNAVIDFCDANGVAYVPIPDVGGTVVIVK
ncbi:MAG: TylF/MycF family methyltransferase [Butyrivibrio sp.]|nr:TylF/MycF family methyltransferase [Butyrivibrio sp.]